MIKFFKKNFPIILFTLVFIIGLLIMLYPSISNFVNSKNHDNVIVSYNSEVKKIDNTENEKMLEEAHTYNKNLVKTSITDAFSYPERSMSSEYTDVLNVDGRGVMGYISIPKIDVRIPIYHGTSSEVLQKGVGHFEGSSLPVGGEGTHSVLSAHRGLPSARLFTDLDQLKKDDIFYIYVLDEKLIYKVDRVSVIQPSDISLLDITEDGDYITLVTCTPYGVNTHRLLVRGTRIEKVDEVLANSSNKKLSKVDIIFYICLTISIIILIVAIILIVTTNKKEKKKIVVEEELECI